IDEPAGFGRQIDGPSEVSFGGTVMRPRSVPIGKGVKCACEQPEFLLRAWAARRSTCAPLADDCLSLACGHFKCLDCIRPCAGKCFGGSCAVSPEDSL